MIIVEGCDNSGKTTLVNRLSEELRLLSIINREKPPNREYIFHYVATMTFLSSQYSTIFDRWPSISEPIYGPICRNRYLLESEDLTFLHTSVSRISPLVIYCRPKDSTILDFGDRPQMGGVIENGDKLIRGYDVEMLRVARFLQVVNYDYEHDSYQSIFDQVLTHLKGPVQ